MPTNRALLREARKLSRNPQLVTVPFGHFIAYDIGNDAVYLLRAQSVRDRSHDWATAQLPGANVDCIDRLDAETTRVVNAPPAQPNEWAEEIVPSEVVDLIGGGGWTRTNDLGIMRPSL